MSERELLTTLETLTESVAAGQFACRFADRARLDRVAVLTGASIIACYGLPLWEWLPVAAHLAKDCGRSLPEAAAVVSQAAVGSTSGFEQLREEYAVTSEDLVDFGAAVAPPESQSPGFLRLALCCIKDIETNRNALIRFLLSRGGEAA